MTARITDRTHYPKPGRPPTYAYCSWLDDEGNYCETFGPVVKGLCPRHYQMLRRELTALYPGRGGRPDDRPGPNTCVCATPVPVRTRLLPDAFECSTCWRVVL